MAAQRPDDDDGGLLPDVTADERATGWGEDGARIAPSGTEDLSEHDRWLLEQRPPHHDDRD